MSRARATSPIAKTAAPGRRASTPGAAQPFLKWAGGKWTMAQRLQALLPVDHAKRTYREPFVGGGAMFFQLSPKRAILSDALTDLIATYGVMRDDVDALIVRLEVLRATHSKEQFYEIRTRFNAERDASPMDRASWLIYLNKTCYNGLFRTNSKGAFNVPFGRFKNPSIVHPERFRCVSRALSGVELRCARFTHLLDDAKRGEVVYMDPPYDPISATSNFAGYSDGAFSAKDQADLADVFRKLDKRGCLLALSNSDTPRIRKLYEGFDIQTITATRTISAKSATRGTIREVVIRNLAKYPKR